MNREAEPAPGTAKPSGTPLIAFAAVLVGLGAVVLFLVWPRASAPVSPALAHSVEGEREEAPELPTTFPTAAAPERPAPERPAPAPASPGAAAPSALPTVDLFAGQQPELFDRGRQVVLRGGMLQSPKLKELYEFAKAHPGDARPHLLMAGDSANRGWTEFAISHYLRAFKEDPQVRGDERMLKDLVSMVGGQYHRDKAGEAVSTVYGPLALPALERAAAEATEKGDATRADRLSSFAATLR